MHRLAPITVALLLAGCGLPSKDRVQGELQTIAEAGAPPTRSASNWCRCTGARAT